MIEAREYIAAHDRAIRDRMIVPKELMKEKYVGENFDKAVSQSMDECFILLLLPLEAALKEYNDKHDTKGNIN